MWTLSLDMLVFYKRDESGQEIAGIFQVRRKAFVIGRKFVSRCRAATASKSRPSEWTRFRKSYSAQTHDAFERGREQSLADLSD